MKPSLRPPRRYIRFRCDCEVIVKVKFTDGFTGAFKGENSYCSCHNNFLEDCDAFQAALKRVHAVCGSSRATLYASDP